MDKDTFYFQHDFNARSDPKMISLQMKHNMEGVGVYWCIIEMLYENQGYIQKEYDRISFVLRVNEEIVKSVVEDFDLFTLKDDFISSKRVIEQLQFRMSKSTKATRSINKRWDEVRKKRKDF